MERWRCLRNSAMRLAELLRDKLSPRKKGQRKKKCSQRVGTEEEPVVTQRGGEGEVIQGLRKLCPKHSSKARTVKGWPGRALFQSINNRLVTTAICHALWGKGNQQTGQGPQQCSGKNASHGHRKLCAFWKPWEQGRWEGSGH